MAGDLLYAKTQRIVLLIDLNPILITSDPERYLAVVTSAAEKLLSFPPLSASFFSFKFFFSSLSALLSSSKLSGLSLSSPSLSFDLPSPTLVSLRRAVDVLNKAEFRSSSTSSPCGVNVAASMRQIVYDYAWEPVVRDPEIGTIPGFADSGFDIVRSNLVVMFSPFSRDLERVSEFLAVTNGDECLSDLDMFQSKLGEIFESVNDLFDTRDILLSWVDVKFEDGSAESSKWLLKSGFFESGIRELGWGHCSTDSISFCSFVVPFGLIYPAIGICPRLSTSRKFLVQTSLEIADITGKPLECKCGELQLSSSEIFSGNLARRPEEPHKDSIIEQFNNGVTKLTIKALRMCNDLVELERYTCETFFVHEISQELDKDQEQENGFWANRALQILAEETGETVAKRSSPIWQILLSFLYREGYSVLVSLSNTNGSSWTGILKPFTFSSALVSVFNTGVSPQTVDQENSSKKVSSSEYKRKQGKHILNSLSDVSWEEFCRSVKDYADMEDAYFSIFSKSKKFKFLKCWMKQIRKPRGCSLSVSSNCNSNENVQADATEKKINASEETEKSISEEDVVLSGNSISGKQDNNLTSVYASESSENFFASLPSKIKQGIESEDIDLAALAERLVNSCVFYSSQRLEKDNSCESGTLSLVTEELTTMLLKEPKGLVSKFKKKDSSSTAYELKSNETAPSSIVREYELQILFRMEILRSVIGQGSEESTTQKFAKHICTLLEAIQCKLDGGFFGDWSLDKYVDKTIKARYHHILEEVVNIIYTEMDLLLFSDEDLTDNSFMNNEDSSQSGREYIHSKKTKDVPGMSTSTRSHLQRNPEEFREATRRDEEAKKVVEAQERRERAKRFASFTSWMPDLRKVWAPKQGKNSKGKADEKQRIARRKKAQRSVEYDRVCETPINTGSKRIRTDECDSLARSSVPKALFQDDS